MDSKARVQQLLMEAIAAIDKLDPDRILQERQAERDKVAQLANGLNNILQEISGYAALIRSNAEDSAKVRDFLEVIVNSAAKGTQVSAELTRISLTGDVNPRPQGSQSTNLSPTAPVLSKRVQVHAVYPEPPPTEKRPHKASAPPIIHNPTGIKPLIMVVDDEKDICNLTQIVLTAANYKVVIAHSGDEAIGHYKHLSKQIELVLMDFSMPIKDGGETFLALKVVNPKVRVLLTSGYHESDKIKNLLQQGLLGFLPKPYTGEKLLLYIKQVLGV
ncbi:MAG: response regulator [Verrucomicrobiota bacterium]|nr:response regulator [Verrucomicrobiota bacterium]